MTPRRQIEQTTTRIMDLLKKGLSIEQIKERLGVGDSWIADVKFRMKHGYDRRVKRRTERKTEAGE